MQKPHDRSRGFHVVIGGFAVERVGSLEKMVRCKIAVTLVPDWMKWAGAILAFTAAALVGIQTFFNWQKQIEGHRRIASRYLFLSKDCSQLLAVCESKGIPSDLQEQLERLSDRYKEITLDAESFGTNKSDYGRAIEGIKSGEEEYTAIELGLVNPDAGK